MRVHHLQCDYMQNPMGFDLHRPVLNWMVEAEGFGRFQSAFRLQVSREESFDNCLLDTGKQQGRESIGYRLELPLKPCTRYYWRVMIWDEKDSATDYSEPAWFETGRYNLPWTAEWIGWDKEFPQLRKKFALDKPLKQARVYACGLGLYRLFLNGEPATDEHLTPNFNAYDKWLQYQSYDITAALRQGENVLGAWLGNGYYKGRVNWPDIPERRNIYGSQLAMILELDLEYSDGTTEKILTDQSWQVTKSPFDRAEIYDGEIFDARRHDPAWCTPEESDEGWESATQLQLDKGLLQARRSLPVKVMQELPVKAVLHTPAGETVLDFGQNFGGWVRFRARAAAGEKIKLQFGEALTKEGNFYRDNMRTALAELIYISDGKEAWYRPQFTFFGFRYVKVSGLKEVCPEDFVGEVIYSQMADTGAFHCSDDRVNRLFENALWSQRSNFIDIPTDCPQRDERMGWTGDAQVFCATAAMNKDVNAFFRKYLYDLWLEQQDDGFVPVVVPNILRHSGTWSKPTAAWGDAATIIPWTLYLHYGDISMLENQYDSMKAWVDYITHSGNVQDGVYGGSHLGDWLAQDTKDPDNFFGLTPPELIATCYYALSASIVAEAATLLGKEEDASCYRKLGEQVREAFRREFVSPAGRVAAETQTANLVALSMDMLLPAQREKTVERLANRLIQDKMHLTTGFVGTPLLCPTLSENGLNEYAYALLLSEGCPGWLYEVAMGATTTWERWNSVRPDGSFGPVGMNSLNHYAFGSIVEWLYAYVCGLRPTSEAPGFRLSKIRPMPHQSLGHARAEIRTPYGPLSCGWKLSQGEITLDIRIPFGAEADIILPDAEGAAITENGAPITYEDSLHRGSGSYQYHYRYNGHTINKPLPEAPRRH